MTNRSRPDHLARPLAILLLALSGALPARAQAGPAPAASQATDDARTRADALATRTIAAATAMTTTRSPDAATPRTPTASPSKRGDALSFTGGWSGAQVRDEHVSPLRRGGGAWVLGVGLESSDARWVDRLEFLYSTGALDDLSRTGYALRWTLQHRVWTRGRGALFAGGTWRTALHLRSGVTESWDLRSVLEPHLTWRHHLTISANQQLWLEGGVRAPLTGFLLRPGYASPLNGRSLDAGDAVFAAPHNTLGVGAHLTALWLRPSGADVRARLVYQLDRIAIPQPVSRVSLTATLSALWRF